MQDSDNKTPDEKEQANPERRSFLKKAAASVAAVSGTELAFIRAANAAESEMPQKELGTTGLKMPIIVVSTTV